MGGALLLLLFNQGGAPAVPIAPGRIVLADQSISAVTVLDQGLGGISVQDAARGSVSVGESV